MVVILIYCFGFLTTSGIIGAKDVYYYVPLLEIGFEDTLYLPEGAWRELSDTRGEQVVCSDTEVQYEWERTKNGITISYVNCQREARFQLPLYYYPGYTALDTVNHEKLTVRKSDPGLVYVYIGSHDSGEITVSYTGTWIQHISCWISLLTWVGLLIFSWKSFSNRSAMVTDRD